jgi:hypothetical protein
LVLICKVIKQMQITYLGYLNKGMNDG